MVSMAWNFQNRFFRIETEYFGLALIWILSPMICRLIIGQASEKAMRKFCMNFPGIFSRTTAGKFGSVRLKQISNISSISNGKEILKCQRLVPKLVPCLPVMKRKFGLYVNTRSIIALTRNGYL